MINHPTVSVVIPTYRHADYILSTLDSVFAQTFTDYEIIVINDGSPDDTRDVLRPLAEAGRITYVEQENAGQPVARNRGIARAVGKYIALLDDDDLWPPDKLAWQVEALERNPEAALVYGRVKTINDRAEFFVPDHESSSANWLALGPTGRVYEEFMSENHIVSPGLCLIRKDHLRQIRESPFDEDVQGGMDDWEFYLQLARKFPFVSVDRVALHYRVHNANASNNFVSMYLSNLSVRRKMAAQEPDRVLRKRWRAEYCRYADWLAWTAMKSFSSPQLREFGWTRPVALTCLRQVGSFLPSGLIRRIGGRIRVPNRHISRAL